MAMNALIIATALLKDTISQLAVQERGINMNTLIIKLEGKADIPLTTLTTSLLTLASQYNKFLERKGVELDSVKTPLRIKNISSGSIVIELVALVVPVINHLNAISAFVNYLKGSIEFFLKKRKEAPTEYDRTDLEYYSATVNLIIDAVDSNLSISAIDNANQTVNFNISCVEANAVQNEIKNQLANMKEAMPTVHNKKLLIWKDNHTGIIENISPNPIKVIFRNDAVKAGIINSNRLNKAWYELGYIVDVEVLIFKGKPKVYTIINCYPEETFDPEEE